MRKGMSVRAKLTLTFLLLIIIAVTGAFVYHVVEMVESLEKAKEEQNRLFVTAQASKTIDMLITEDINILKTLAGKIKESNPDVVFTVFRDAEGKVIAHSFGKNKPAELLKTKPITKESSSEIVVPGFGELTVFSTPIETYGSLTIGFKRPSVKELLLEEIKDFAIVYIIAIFIGILISLFVSARITVPLRTLVEGIERVGKGELVELEVKSTDELGEIAMVFNETMQKLRAYIQTEEERKKTQENVIQFLDVVSTAAEGNFGRRAPVTADVFGSIADAFNLMMDELSNLIRDVRKTAEGVGEESFTLLEMLKRMSEGAESQMVQLKEATEAIDQTANATLQISEKTEEATRISKMATDAASKGGQLVNQSIEGMQLIRVTVQSINKKMKMLSERIMEIGTISGLIGEIASRTNLLAMNASIEAARAGEAGKGFVVIAEEIRGLADRSAEATKEITNIIRAIQSEAGEITTSLEEETEIVERQTALATETGTSFDEIQNSIQKSTGVVSEIYDISQTQREMTGKVVLSMESVNRISLELLKLVQDTEGISEKLTASSRELLGSVDKFILEERKEEAIEHAG
ncbi:MAG: methyl-accepting chemotaxis protein [Nitrospirae bacterium]|nr:MAG: methyl-accepting chemotaxis protein [Nitrospirota bacterium]